VTNPLSRLSALPGRTPDNSEPFDELRRWPGARIKHRVKNNWLRMYDEFGWVLRIETVINFQTELSGENSHRGFRNTEIRTTPYRSTEDDGKRRRRSHAVGRMLKRWHVRGLILIAKVARSRRWHVSVKGRQVLGAVVRLSHEGIPAAIATAA
jgi:hypothetical protein